MAVNQVIYDGETLMDLTSDTVTAEMLAEGVTAHGADGEVIVGMMGVVKKYQGTENVGKILVVGTDGNLILIDMPECEASGNITATHDGAGNVTLTIS